MDIDEKVYQLCDHQLNRKRYGYQYEYDSLWIWVLTMTRLTLLLLFKLLLVISAFAHQQMSWVYFCVLVDDRTLNVNVTVGRYGVKLNVELLFGQ